ncbi:MAG: hypothetical protein IT210_20220 [Armatimonadetes bacterium]|nr:hypothetical protein [Armatimonadota bacterium]
MVAGVLCALFRCAVPETASASPLYRWWPAFPAPKRVIKSVTFHGLPPAEQFVLQALAGLSAQAVKARKSDAMIWITFRGNEPYDAWFRRMTQTVRPKVEPGERDVWELTRWLKNLGMLRGYVLYTPDDSERTIHEKGPMDVSANVATSLCGILQAIPIPETLRARAEGMGLRLLEDARGRDEAWCLERYGSRFSRAILSMNDPKNPQTREMAVASKAFVCSRADAVLERVLNRLRPGSPILGWGVGDERELTLATTRYAAFQTATNWCVNLHLLAEPTGGLYVPPARLRRSKRQVRTLRDIRWEDNVHYACYVLSDGDNVQWVMGNFISGEEAPSFWGNPERGKAPFGWTIPLADLRQVSPYTLEALMQSAAPDDGLVLMSGGYYYPDAFGQKRGGNAALERHARRVGAYMSEARVPLLAANFLRWDSPEALAACGIYARNIPGLLGILGFQYYPYTGGAGGVRWVRDARGRDAPAAAARYAIWNHAGREREGTPLQIARLLAERPHSGPVDAEDRFSWVIVHCWSWFRQAPPGSSPEEEEAAQKPSSDPTVQRGYAPALWSIRALPEYVRAVTPEEFFLQMRLRLRPLQTLDGYLDATEKTLRRLQKTRATAESRSRLARALLAFDQARRLLRAGLKSQAEQRECFELARQADMEAAACEEAGRAAPGR